MTYSDAINYLYSFIDYEKVARYNYNRRAMNIEREVALLDLLGNPHWDLKCIHIAGSKGKGSTAAMVDAILRAAGYRVGLYTSPHLVDFRERIRVNGGLITEEEVCRGVETLLPCVEQLKENPDLRDVTFWEVWTALAFHYFVRSGVDYAVVEVGLGGRLDGTNVIHPLVAAITTLGMDHTDKLGDTIAKIAAEKAGIIKEGINVVSSPQVEEGCEVIRRVCQERHAHLIELGHDVLFERIEGTVDGEILNVEGPYGTHRNLRVPLIGTHQTVNAATAVTVVDLLRTGRDERQETKRQRDKRVVGVSSSGRGDSSRVSVGWNSEEGTRRGEGSPGHTFSPSPCRRVGVEERGSRLSTLDSQLFIPERAIYNGLQTTVWPGRFQIVEGQPAIILDGAHTPESAARLRETIDELFPKRRFILIFGMNSDKQIKATWREIADLPEVIILTRVDLPRAAHPEHLREAIGNIKKQVIITHDVSTALGTARHYAGPEDLILVTGSLYIIGDAMKALGIIPFKEHSKAAR